MTFLLITGNDPVDLLAADQALRAAGMAAPNPSVRDSQHTLATWHRDILARLKHDPAALSRPGRIWEQLAIDVLLANMNAGCWGWSGQDGLPLLDFWAGFETDSRFVLLCDRLDEVLIRFVTENAPLDTLPTVVNAWRSTHETMLRFHLRQPATSTLLWGHQARAESAALLLHIKQKFGIADHHLALPASTTGNGQGADELADNPLLQFIAHTLSQQQPEAIALAHELDASVHPLGTPSTFATRARPQQLSDTSDACIAPRLITGYRDAKAALTAETRRSEQAHARIALERALEQTHKEASQNLQRLQESTDAHTERLQQEYQQLSHELQEVQERLDDVMRESGANEVRIKELDADLRQQTQLAKERQATIDTLARAKTDAQAQIEALNKTVEQARTQAEQKRKETNQENELLLAQLHQVQEELERYFLDLQSTKTTLEVKEKELKAAVEKDAAETKAKTEALTAREGAIKQLDQTKQALQKGELRIKELDAALSKQTQLAKERQATIDTLARAKTDALAQIEALNKTLEQARAQAEQKLKETNQENELLLAQLHQVQEELERYFLDYRAAQVKLDEHEELTRRALAGAAGGFDCRALALIDASDPAAWRWRATDVRMAGHRIETLEYGTLIDQGVMVVTLERDGGKPAPLLRWPLSARDSNTLRLAPLKDQDGGTSGLTALAQLSTSDWDMTLGLLKRMLRQLAKGHTPADAQALSEKLPSIGRAIGLLEQLPPILRFDEIKLTGQNATPKREVIGLRFEHITLGSARIAEVEVQFQAQPQGDTSTLGAPLGGEMYLIFGREAAADPFETWASNAKDAAGREVMAIPVSAAGPLQPLWSRLSPADHAFILALVDAIPLGLALLQRQGTRTQRPLKDWALAAGRMREWLRLPPNTKHGDEVTRPVDVLAVEQVAPTAATPSTRPTSRTARRAQVTSNNGSGIAKKPVRGRRSAGASKPAQVKAPPPSRGAAKKPSRGASR